MENDEGKVTISLSKFREMEKEIASLRRQVKQKTIIKEVTVFPKAVYWFILVAAILMYMRMFGVI